MTNIGAATITVSLDSAMAALTAIRDYCVSVMGRTVHPDDMIAIGRVASKALLEVAMLQQQTPPVMKTSEQLADELLSVQHLAIAGTMDGKLAIQIGPIVLHLDLLFVYAESGPQFRQFSVGPETLAEQAAANCRGILRQGLVALIARLRQDGELPGEDMDWTGNAEDLNGEAKYFGMDMAGVPVAAEHCLIAGRKAAQGVACSVAPVCGDDGDDWRVVHARLLAAASTMPAMPSGVITNGPGKVFSYRECSRCLRILADNSGDDCPNHTLSCCGGKGAEHVVGCQKDPMFVAGMKTAERQEQAFLEAIAVPIDPAASSLDCTCPDLINGHAAGCPWRPKPLGRHEA